MRCRLRYGKDTIGNNRNTEKERVLLLDTMFLASSPSSQLPIRINLLRDRVLYCFLFACWILLLLLEEGALIYFHVVASVKFRTIREGGGTLVVRTNHRLFNSDHFSIFLALLWLLPLSPLSRQLGSR